MTLQVDGRRPVDVLVVRVGTTFGLRRSDAELVAALEALGLTAATASTDFGLLGRMRFRQPITDLVEAAAIRTAVTRALRAVSPRAIIYPSSISAIFEPSARLAIAAVRFDALAAEHRPGKANAGQRMLERRLLRRARLLLPWSLRRPHPPERRPPWLSLPPPVEADAVPARSRRSVVVCYAGGGAWKKGLDIIARAWWLAGPPSGYRLLVTGIEESAGQGFLEDHGIDAPHGITWCGKLAPHEQRKLTSNAEIYLAASRFEPFGIGPLEALADGALLVTLPTEGAVDARHLAGILDDRLVATQMTPEALAEALGHALALPERAVLAYRQRAQQLIAPYSRAALQRRLNHDILPLLLGERRDGAAPDRRGTFEPTQR